MGHDSAGQATAGRPRASPRVTGIDLFRGALVVLVVLGHFAEITQRHHILTWLGYGFRMPLFIGLTGYLFNLEQARRVSAIALLGKYYDRLILPWMLACAVALAITGSLDWPTPFSAVIRPPYHLWFVPVMLAFILAARACRLTPATMLAAAIPLSIGSMYVFGVGHHISQFGAWMPDRRYFIYPIYFALGMWVARQDPVPLSRNPLLLGTALAALIWWIRLYDHASTAAEAAAQLLLCVPLILLFPQLKTVRFDIRPISAVGRDSLFFYLWHPLSFAIWSAAGLSGMPLLAASIATILAAWAVIAQAPLLSRILGLRRADLPPRLGSVTPSDTVSTGGAI